MPERQLLFPGLQVGIAFDAAVVPQHTGHGEAIEPRRLADADLQRERVLAGRIDYRRASVRLPPAAPDFLLAAEHLKDTAMAARVARLRNVTL